MSFRKLNFLTFLLLSFSFFSLQSCLKDEASKKNEEETTKINNYVSANSFTNPTASGLYIKHIVVGAGSAALTGENVLLNFSISKLTGEVLRTNDTILAKNNSINAEMTIGGAFKMIAGSSYTGFNEALATMKTGGKATFVIPSSLWANDYEPVLVSLELLKVLPTNREYEVQQISAFLDSAKVNTSLTLPLKFADSTKVGVTGLYFFEMVKGTGILAPDGKTANVTYTGRLMDGRKFDTGTLDMVVGGGRMIQGFEQAVKMMAVGAKVKIVIPYLKAYGLNNRFNSKGQIVIPYASSLVFEIKLNSLN